MQDYLFTFIIFVIAFWLGWRVRTAIVLHHLKEDPDKMIGILNKIKEINEGEAIIEQVKGDVKIEHHHGHVYLFEKETDKFLAQGSTIAEAIEIMDKRFPGRFGLTVTVPDNHSA